MKKYNFNKAYALINFHLANNLSKFLISFGFLFYHFQPVFSQNLFVLDSKIHNHYITKINGVTYYKNVPFTGKFVELYDNGKARVKGEMLNGVWHGPCSIYFLSGNLWKLGTYSFGLQDQTSTEYHSNGKVRSIGNYLDGKKNGYWESFHDNGRIDVKASYDHDLQVGEWVFYKPNGSKFRELYFVNGLKNGFEIIYQENGVIDVKTPYIMGVAHGIQSTFYSTGELYCQSNYVQDEIIGDVICFFKSGVVQSRGQKVNSKNEGEFYYFNEYGSLVRNEIWNNNNRISYKLF